METDAASQCDERPPALAHPRAAGGVSYITCPKCRRQFVQRLKHGDLECQNCLFVWCEQAPEADDRPGIPQSMVDRNKQLKIIGRRVK